MAASIKIALLMTLLCAAPLAAQTDVPTPAKVETEPAPEELAPSIAPIDEAKAFEKEMEVDPNDPRGVASSLDSLVWPAIKTMLMLLVVLGLVYLSLHKGLGKLISRTQSGKRIQVVERVSLDQKRALFLVSIDGEEMLLGASEGGLTQLKSESKRSFEMPESQGVKVAETGVLSNGDRISLKKDHNDAKEIDA